MAPPLYLLGENALRPLLLHIPRNRTIKTKIDRDFFFKKAITERFLMGKKALNNPSF
jgi:hypothetical protein